MGIWWKSCLLLALASLLGSCLAEQCGSQAGGALCPGGLCCSQWGYCGTTADYCGNGCQSQCPGGLTLLAEQCGSQAGGALCPEGLCCSQWGYCGNTDAYCGNGCQSQCPTGGNTVQAEQCGSQAGGAVCPGGLCCSQWGYCGTTEDYCGNGCQSQCSGGSITLPSPENVGGVGSLIDRSLFNQMLKHRDDAACPAKNFYTYEAFIAAADAFPAFGTTGDTNTRKREIAAFLAQTSHETTGGWASAPDGPYAWGYCYRQEQGNPGDYCVKSAQWPCAPGKKYYGRGPIQISYNFNYGAAGKAIGADLLKNPDLVATNPTISFKTAFWFWMTPQSPKPSCHSVMTGGWKPSSSDNSAGRAPGFGVVTNIINGGLECGKGPDARVADRIGFYKRYCDLLKVTYGNNLDCYHQKAFGVGHADI